jgi:predicted RNA-binding Zn-ribbon protein involved in translation (DUF1610 family)
MSENAIVLQTGNDFLVPAASLEQVLATYQWKKDFIESVLKVNVDYGVTPGTSDKPSLKKPGAEKMASFFGLAPVFEDVATVEDWTGEAHGNEPFFYYRQKCKLYRGDRLIASADGSCNSWEKKYRYRSTDRVCPTCGKATIFKSKRNPEWYCWDKKGGCGATFKINDERIVNQETGQVKNPDVAELTNTILKMSQKRALVAAVLIATNASDYFTQDLDDFVTGEIIDGTARPVTDLKQESVIPSRIDPEAIYHEAAARIVKTGNRELVIGDMTKEQLDWLIANGKDQRNIDAALIVLQHDFAMAPEQAQAEA